MESSSSVAYHALKLETITADLRANVDVGLDGYEAVKRLEQFGPNAIARKENNNLFLLFLKQFSSPIVYLLLFAALLSFFFKEWLDAIAILIVVVLNAAIGFYMELRAQQSMLALKRLSSVPAKVFRDGKLLEVSSEQVVPGDIVYVEAGDMIPADGKVFRTTQLLIDESALTGESLPVEKKETELPIETILADRINMAYKGTYVSRGNAYLLVCGTGMETELGKIAGMVKAADQVATPLEKKLEEFSKTLIKITAALVILIFFVGMLNGNPVVEMLETAIALAVAAIPEGLPIVATLSLAQGMLKMARHNVVVKNLSAVETLGGTNVICTDKTGTLTQNKMEVSLLRAHSLQWTYGEHLQRNKAVADLMIRCAVLCNTATFGGSRTNNSQTGDPLEIALLKFALEQGIDIDQLRKDYVKVREEPFSSETRIMATAHQYRGEVYVFAKGAIEELIKQCSYIHEDGVSPLSDELRGHWLRLAEVTASTGQRLIASAYKKMETIDTGLATDLVFLGLIGMVDPPRPEVFDAIDDCKSAGIKVIMITGDHPSTARQIGAQLGIADGTDAVMVGRNMKDYEQLSEDEKQAWINTKVFARVNPKHKLDLVKVLQEKNYIVGMTGDGINDAPALKKADIGIAMGLRGTQVAQEVSDMVLKDDSFSSIVVAVKQGRVIFENIKKFVTFLLSCNLSELLVIAIVAILNLHFQLYPLQILFINLITDVLPALALGATRGAGDIMNKEPRSAKEPILKNRDWLQIISYSGIISLSCVGAVYLYHYLYHRSDPWDAVICNNILFFTLILTQLLHVLNMGKGNIFKTEVFRNRYVWFALTASVGVLLGAIRIPLIRRALDIVPMNWQEWLIILLCSGIAMIALQLVRRGTD